MFTFCLAILLMMAMEKAKGNGPVVFALVSLLCVAAGSVAGQLTMVDYYGSGVVTVLVFYLCRGRSWGRLGELAGLIVPELLSAGRDADPRYPAGTHHRNFGAGACGAGA